MFYSLKIIMSIDATCWMIENKNLFLLEIGILNAGRRIGDRSSISSGNCNNCYYSVYN